MPKVNRTQVVSVEISHKFRRWHSQRKCDHFCSVGGKLEEDVSKCNELEASSRCDHENLCGPSKYYINSEISTRNTERRGKQFIEDSYLDHWVPSSAVFDPPLLTCPYILCNKRKRKEADYIFYICAVVFFCYTTLWSYHRTKKRLWNMKVTVIPIVIRALVIIPKWFVRGLEELDIGGRAETIQSTT